MKRVRLDPRAPAADRLREAAAAIAAGGVVAFPTDTLYGLAVDPYNAKAVERLFAAKGRPSAQAVALVAADLEQVEAWLGRLPTVAIRLAERFWPGPLTLVVRVTNMINTEPAERGGEDGFSVDPARSVFNHRLAPGIAASDGTVGVRVPDHAVARGLCRAVGRPLTATSANPSGQSATADPDEVERALGRTIDLLLDAGPTSGGPPSTLVDASVAGLRLVRAGAIDWDTIQRCARGE